MLGVALGETVAGPQAPRRSPQANRDKSKQINNTSKEDLGLEPCNPPSLFHANSHVFGVLFGGSATVAVGEVRPHVGCGDRFFARFAICITFTVLTKQKDKTRTRERERG